MHAQYEQMEKNGLVGPFVKVNDQLVPRPGYRSDYPKAVYPKGTQVKGEKVVPIIVRSLKEELEVTSGLGISRDVVDPLAKEREEVSAQAQELTQAQASLAAQTKEMSEGLRQIAEMKETLAAQQRELAASMEQLNKAQSVKVPITQYTKKAS